MNAEYEVYEAQQAQVQPFKVTPLVLAFLAGVFGALLVDAVKTRFFPLEQNNVAYVHLSDFMTAKVNEYGAYTYKNESDKTHIAAMFSEAVEETLVEFQLEYQQPIFVGPAVITGGIDLTGVLDTRVSERMEEYMAGRGKNALPK